MELTKTQKLVAKVCAKESYGRAIRYLRHENGKLTGTDSFSLIEMKKKDAPDSEAVLLDQNTFEPVETHDDYPEYEQLFAPRRDTVTIEVNAKFLARVADIMSKVDEHTHHVTMELSKFPNRAIVFTANGKEHSARALLMPIMQVDV